MARTSVLGLLAVVIAANAACVSRRLAPPPKPAPLEQRVDLSDVVLSLRGFSLEGEGENSTQMDVERLQDRFLDYVERAAIFRAVEYNLSGRRPTPEPGLELTVEVELVEQTKRTYVLDAVNVPLLGIWPLVPAWGEAQVNVVARFAPSGADRVIELREQVRAPYTTLFYSWYRPGPIEDAFERATTEAFARIAVAIPAAVLAERGTVVTTVGGTSEPSPTGAEAIAPIVDWPTELPTRGVRVIETRTPTSGVVATILDTLGGVELAGFKGIARVSSTARLESGDEVEVAAGTALQTGYRIGLYSAPEVTGVFIYPALGYVSQKIDNVDARSELFRLNSIEPDQGDIGAIATDPDTGGAVDAGAANVYHLDMQSGYAGVRAGASLVAGTPSVEFFASFALGVNVVEYRKIRSVLDNCETDAAAACRTRHRGWDFIRSGAVGATFGVRLPKLHTALRFIFDYEVYREFEYERPLDVRGPAVYDVDNEIFQHELLPMESASLSSASFQLALAVVY